MFGSGEKKPDSRGSEERCDSKGEGPGKKDGAPSVDADACPPLKRIKGDDRLKDVSGADEIRDALRCCEEVCPTGPIKNHKIVAPAGVPKSKEFDYVDAVLDEVLETEKSNVQRILDSLDEREREERENDERGAAEGCVARESRPRNAFNTKITIRQDSTTVEVLNFDGCRSEAEVFSAEPRDGAVDGGSEPDGEQDSKDPLEGREGAVRESDNPCDTTRHPNTLRRYTAMLLAFFGNVRVEYLSGGKVYTRKLPVFYGNREKLLYLEEHEMRELMNGNTNFLPRASLVLESLTYDQQRQNNKNVPVARELTGHGLAAKNAFAYVTAAPSPYNVSVRLNIVTRGMTDATMLVEQIASYFNPFHTFTMVEEQIESQVRLRLDGITLDHPEMDQFSNNEVALEFGFTLFGNMYKPRYKEYIVDTINLRI